MNLQHALRAVSLLMSGTIAGLLTASPTRAAEIPLHPTVPESMGVNIHFTDPRPGEMQMLADGGFKWVRMDLGWNGTERTPNQYDFSAYDRLLKALDAYEIHAILILDYSTPNYDDGLSPFTDAGRNAFAKWAVAAATHFQHRGVLWEMYNEPNGGFWKPKADAAAYTRLALVVGKALRQAAPEETYIGPAMAGMDYTYLQKCFDAGVLEYFSAVTVHPYRQDGPETVAKDYARLRAMIAQSSPAGKSIPLICGEWGYSERFHNQNEANQGKTLVREFLTNLSQGIPISIWYDWHDDGEDPKDPEHHFGIVHHAIGEKGATPYVPKDAYIAARMLAETFAGYRFEKRLPVGGPEDYILQLTDGAAPKISAWTSGAEAHEVTIPVQGEFHLSSYLGDDLGKKAAAGDGLHITLNDAPVYLK
jgi:hypothetical protein